MHAVLTDLWRTARRLARTPGFTLPVVATLALGLGSVAAIFTIVNAVLIRPLPYPDADQLVAIHHAAPGWGITRAGMSEATYVHYRTYARDFAAIGAYIENTVSLTDLDHAERVPVALVTPSVATVLKVTPALGRNFVEADIAPGGPAVAMISYELWVRRYGADRNLIGRTIEANTKKLQVVGILPPGFEFPRPGTAVWYADGIVSATPRVRDFYLGGIARLAPQISSAAAERDLHALVPTMAGTYQDFSQASLAQAQLRPLLTPLKQDIISSIQLPLMILLCTMGLVLFISWANVGNLFLVRGTSRRREIALQCALGASTTDLVRGFLCESLLLAVPAAIVGLLIAQSGLIAILNATLEPIPRLREIRLDSTVVAIAMGLTLLTSLALAALSLAHAGRLRLTSALRAGGSQTTASPQQRVIQRALVSLQVALALVVVIGSAVMLQSLWKLKQVDLGFHTADRVTFSVALIGSQYPNYNDQMVFYDELMRQLQAQPGVQGAAAVGNLPLTAPPVYLQKTVSLTPVTIASATADSRATLTMVTPGYFELMGLSIEQGQPFDPGMVIDRDIPVMISRALADQLSPGRSVVGQRLYTPEAAKYAPFVIRGVVSNVRGTTLSGGPGRTVYFPTLKAAATIKPQVYAGTMSIIVRTNLPESSSLPIVRETLHRLNPNLAMGDVQTLQTIVDKSMSRTHLVALLLTIAAATGLLLALVGVFGLTSYLVSQRLREMAVRVAIGAQPADVKRLVLSNAALTIVIGLVAGLVGSVIVTRALSTLLFQVDARDPLTFVVAPVLMLLIALIAGYVPARRAARVDPMRALASD